MGGVLEPIVWPILAPLLGACLLLMFDRRGLPWLRMLPPIATTMSAAWLALRIASEGTLTHTLGGWSAPLGIVLRADGLSAFLVAATAVVGLMVSLHASSRRSWQGQAQARSFWLLWSFTWLGLNAVFLSADLFNLYVALEVLGIGAVCLVTLAGGAARIAAVRYVLVTLFGSLFFLLGVALVYAEYGILDLALLASRARWTPGSALALALMTFGMALKAALFPLHFWLPPAHARALAPVSAIVSGLVCNAPFYVVLRLWTSGMHGVSTAWSAELVGGLGIAAIAYGSVQALRQRSLKMLVAYSTVAQLGYLFLAVPLSMHDARGAAFSGGAYFVATHACAKAAMFLAAGTFARVLGSDALSDLRGASIRLPLTTFSFALAGVTLIGLPPTGGFIAKWLLLEAAIGIRHWTVAVVIVAGSLLTAAYVFLPVAQTIRGSHVEPPLREDVPLATEIATFVLALTGVLLGLVSHAPVSLLELARPVVVALGMGWS